VLNCETRISSVRKLVLISVIACAGAILLSGLLVTLASRRAVEPTIRNMEQQKQFITNASHELKTPLTVIATNMELLQMESGNNRWVLSTQKQTAQLRRLVDELVYLSRMEEEYPTLSMEPLDPGKLLEETAEPFAAMAEFNGKEMRVSAEEGLRMTGDRASIQRLMSTLCDNAVKYASEGPIVAEIREEGKNILLQVSNPVAEPLSRQQCEQLFNRFYRADPSRNKGKKSGFGIGLAIAAAIAEKHGGRISAAMEENRLVFRCILPKEPRQ
jgi:signal transduction histidine kinase